MADNAENKVLLKTSDNAEYSMDRDIATKSITLKNLIEEIGPVPGVAIPLMNVSKASLTLIDEYLQYHRQFPAPPTEEKKDERRTDDIIPWDKEFCGKLDQPALFELILAANFLEIKELLDLTCKTVANMIKGKTPEEIRKTFNIKNDFSPDEEEQIRKENEWCDERQ